MLVSSRVDDTPHRPWGAPTREAFDFPALSDLASKHERPEAADASAPDRASLDTLVEQFVSAIERGFPQRLKRRPKTLKRRVQYLIRTKLPPHPRPAGRPPRIHITRAVEMYRRQKREVEQGKRAEVNWLPIAQECIPGFAKIRSELKRRVEVTRLRNAVYARERRKCGAHKRRRRSSHRDILPAA